MRILGVDPGTRFTGWGVVEPYGPRGRRIASGIVRAGEKRSLPARLKIIHDALTKVIEAHAPTVVAVEDVFFAKFAQSALKLGHARGVALLVAANAGLEVFAYPPALVKRTVAGKGSAAKEQVGQMVRAILTLPAVPPTDEGDALAIAITHMQNHRSRAMLDKARR